MRNRNLYNVILISLLMTLAISIPFNYLVTYFNAPEWSVYALNILVRLLLVIYINSVCIKFGYYSRLNSKPNYRNLAVLSPCLLACFSNLLFILFAKASCSPVFDLTFVFELVTALLTAYYEEIIFRLLYHNMIRVNNRLVRIIASSGIFALFHALSVFNYGFSLIVLVQVVYTFGLGILLGFIYTYGRNIVPCMIFHFLFNFFNSVLYSALSATVYTDKMYLFYLVPVVIAVVLAVYLGIMYLFRFRKKEDEFYWN